MASYNGNTSGIQPKITLYTNHLCPFAHRAHVTLAELGLDYEEVIIDLDVPREPWYLEINPRGLVPSIKYSVPGIHDDVIITESAIVAQFLADARPGHLLPGSLEDPWAPVFRARVAFFLDTWGSKVQPSMYPILKADGAEKQRLAEEMFGAVEKEIEPLLKDAGPFFGGRERPTLVEAIVGPFLLRFVALSNGDLFPTEFKEKLLALPNTGKWAKEVLKLESLLGIWDEEKVIKRIGQRVKKMKEAAKADAAK